MEGIIRDEQLKKDAFYQSVYDNLRDIDRRQHENFAFSHQMLNLLEQEKEIQEILDREIKEWKGQWEHYLNTKPLPALPKNKIKGWGGDKFKTEFKQMIEPKEFPKPIKSSLFKPLLIFSLFSF